MTDLIVGDLLTHREDGHKALVSCLPRLPTYPLTTVLVIGTDRIRYAFPDEYVFAGENTELIKQAREYVELYRRYGSRHNRQIGVAMEDLFKAVGRPVISIPNAHDLAWEILKERK